ncbi:hypothetical protein Dsin_023140 [Dipteronia sinensis]|uniref:DUF7086 domain-containing protein n=1 Tax=Dipteronia sinensis TaxID=43782 RepID=A0AAE0A2T7_9ROSI|nr:hypothetical protein Dsin_023140 [Dipteronia sinensis]
MTRMTASHPTPNKMTTIKMTISKMTMPMITLRFEYHDFAWAMVQNSVVQTMAYLEAHNLEVVQNKLICDGCHLVTRRETNVRDHLEEIQNYLVVHRLDLQNLAPSPSYEPISPTCPRCQLTFLRPVLSPDSSNINKLFLFCEKMIDFCNR